MAGRRPLPLHIEPSCPVLFRRVGGAAAWRSRLRAQDDCALSCWHTSPAHIHTNIIFDQMLSCGWYLARGGRVLDDWQARALMQLLLALLAIWEEA